MKKIFALVAAFAMMLSFVACTDKEDSIEETINSTQTGTNQYLVMFYGVGGGNLDPFIVGNILQSLNSGSSDRVKMTYQFRFSKSFADSAAVFHNILRFTADENADLMGKVCLDSTGVPKYVLPFFERNIHTSHFGDSKFVMASDTALASFIKWSKAKYPKATKTILILSDHGGGWSVLDDGINNNTLSTRSILSDDNTRNTDGHIISLSEGEVKSALINTGKVDMLYDDACMMSTWENLTSYSEATNYFMGSLETAPGIGGNHYFFINRLKEVDATDDGLQTAMHSYIDDVVDKWWEEYSKVNVDDVIYGDLALYDLRKIAAPLSIINEMTKALVERYKDSTDVPGLTDTTLGTKWKDYINAAISNCEVATSYETIPVAEQNIPQDILDSLNAFAPRYLQIYGEPIYTIDEGEKYYNGNMVLKYFKKLDLYTLHKNPNFQQYMKLWDSLADGTFDSYPVSDFVFVLSAFLDDAGCTDTTYADLCQRYYEALRQLGYIRCTRPLQGILYPAPYLLCSPGVLIYPFNEKAFTDENTFSFRYSNYSESAEETLGYYQATDFDKRVQWSEFLKIIDRAPDIVGNPSREEFK